jgi:hypothetical protein
MPVMPACSLPSPNRLDRYKLGEDVVLSLTPLYGTVDPQWGPEWEAISRKIMEVDDAAHELWQMLLPDEIRYDPRSP